MAKKAGDSNGTDFANFMDAFDWQEAMKYAKFEFGDIKRIIYSKKGINDEENWELIVELKDGKFGWLSAWCDYSGWGCQEGGESTLYDTEEQARTNLEVQST